MSMAPIAEQDWSARRYAETAHFVPELGAPVLELLAPSTGERILDLGRGDGALTEKIVAAGAVVVAVDAALPTSIEPWLDTFGEAFLDVLAEPDRSSARPEVAELLRPVLVDETGTWIADHVRLRFRTTLRSCEASSIAR